ncbi:MAG: hypothetical protein HAW67_05270 [Endozoicomonadaceae bacterium]|nr:hypothetical protein [Endozoicomonadaceae bacterium]
MTQTFTTTLIFDASITLDIEAKTASEAADLIFNTDKANPSLCHSCAREVNLASDVATVRVEDEEGNLLFSNYRADELTDQLKEKNAMLDWLLDRVGVDEGGVFFGLGNNKQSNENTLIAIKKHLNAQAENEKQ